MSSILTNMSAMSAVANLAATQKSLATVQNQISTGLKVSSAQDNAAYYSIATNMRTNISNLSAVSDSLNLGSSVVATASNAMKNITTILQSIQAALTSASQPGTDLTSIGTNITALNKQLANTVASASFNSVNLLDGSQSANLNFVAGVSGSGGNTAVTSIAVDTTALNFTGADNKVSNPLANAAFTADDAYTNGVANNTNATSKYNDALDNYNLQLDIATTNSSNYSATQVAAANKALYGTGTGDASATAGSLSYALYKGGNATDGGAAGSLMAAVYGANGTAGAATSGGTYYTLNGADAADPATTSLAGQKKSADQAATGDVNANKIYSGALSRVGLISLTSGDSNGTGATSSTDIAKYLKVVGLALTAANNATESLGASAKNIDLQSTYTSSLSDTLTTGVGSLVDADMNEASTRLNALQTQQQLGVQALSVANQNSQLILKLFQ